MSLDTSTSPAPEPEPGTTPSELWLCSSAGVSFPAAGRSEAAYLTERPATGTECGQGHGLHRTPWRCDLVVDISCK